MARDNRTLHHRSVVCELGAVRIVVLRLEMLVISRAWPGRHGVLLLRLVLRRWHCSPKELGCRPVLRHVVVRARHRVHGGPEVRGHLRHGLWPAPRGRGTEPLLARSEVDLGERVHHGRHVVRASRRAAGTMRLRSHVVLRRQRMLAVVLLMVLELRCEDRLRVLLRISCLALITRVA